MERRREVERDDRVPLLGREVLDRGDMLHPGIVDEDVDRADLVHHRGDGARVHEVRAVVGRAQLLAQRGNGVRLAEAVENHLGALGRQSTRDGQADAGGRSGDEGAPVFEHPPQLLHMSAIRQSLLPRRTRLSSKLLGG